jgi:hypothetical protein
VCSVSATSVHSGTNLQYFNTHKSAAKFVRYCWDFAWFQASAADWTRSASFRIITAVCSGNSLPTVSETCRDSERSYSLAGSFKAIPCSCLWEMKQTHLASKAKLCEISAVPRLYLTELSPLRSICHLCFPRIQIWGSYPQTEFPCPSSRIQNETRVIRHPCSLLPTLRYLIYPASWCSNEPVGLPTFLWYTFAWSVASWDDIFKKNHCSILENVWLPFRQNFPLILFIVRLQAEVWWRDGVLSACLTSF